MKDNIVRVILQCDGDVSATGLDKFVEKLEKFLEKHNFKDVSVEITN